MYTGNYQLFVESWWVMGFTEGRWNGEVGNRHPKKERRKKKEPLWLFFFFFPFDFCLGRGVNMQTSLHERRTRTPLRWSEYSPTTQQAHLVISLILEQAYELGVTT